MKRHDFQNIGTPQWLIEGSAVFVGYSFNEVEGTYTYQQGRDEEVLQRSYQTSPHEPLSAYDYNTVVGNVQTFDPYGIGEIATEYIVASSGMNGLLDIFRNIGKGEDFKTAFQNATGVTLNDFYNNFEVLRGSVGMPHGI